MLEDQNPAVHLVDQPYPLEQFDEHGPRYGVIDARFALRGAEDQFGLPDPYGVLIEYYDKKTRQQGLVKLMHHQVPTELWPSLNNAINAILVRALTAQV